MPESPLSVLIVEDEALIAEELRDRLAHLGCRVAGVVDTAAAAVETAEKRTPDLVLMDIRLKGKADGIAAGERIYRQLDIPVVYLTAHSDKATFERAKATAPFGYLVKPLHERELMIALEMALHWHQREQRLRQSDLTYSTILDGLSDGVIASDGAARVRLMNRAAESLLGFGIGEANGLLAEQVLNLADEATGAALDDVVAQVLASGVVVRLPARHVLVSRGKDAIPVEAIASPVKGNTGAVVGAVVALRDLRERRRAEARFLAVLEAAPIAMVILDRGDRIALVNSRAEQVFGHPRGDLVGQPAAMLLPVRLRDRFRPVSDGLETYCLRKDGTEFPAELRFGLLPELEGVVCSVIDTTERKRAEDERADLNRLLVENARRQLSGKGGSGAAASPALDEVIEQAIGINAETLARHGVIVERDLAPGVAVKGDRHRILEILVNLIATAKEAVIAAGGTARRVHVRAGRDDGAGVARVEVSHGGAGIQPKDVARVFAMAFSGESASGGFGLDGATLTARELGGALSARSNHPHPGTTFVLELPLKALRGARRAP